jgi:hypothetical protein
MAEELKSTDIYEDSDLAPLSSLFGEMGRDRSFWTKIGDAGHVLFDVGAAILTFGTSLTHPAFRKSFNYHDDEVNKELKSLGDFDRKDFFSSDEMFIKLTSFRKSEMAHIKDEKNRQLIFEKIGQSGLLELAQMAGGLQEFARLRFQNEQTLRKSASEFNNPIRDTIWLDKLIQAKNFFYKDPFALTTVYKYFPNLYRLYISALAATADYGYSEEDALNNHEQIMEKMFKAFGTDDKGDAIFKPIWAIDNFLTGQRIEKEIKNIGFGSSNPPKTPDIFHLRLGAANFYVPPVSINVNTGFKTGSLTGRSNKTKKFSKIQFWSQRNNDKSEIVFSKL